MTVIPFPSPTPDPEAVGRRLWEQAMRKVTGETDESPVDADVVPLRRR